MLIPKVIHEIGKIRRLSSGLTTDRIDFAA